MTRFVQCIKLKKKMKGLDYPPFPNKLGIKIYNNISHEAWNDWLKLQIIIINENYLNISDKCVRKYLIEQMELFLFSD